MRDPPSRLESLLELILAEVRGLRADLATSASRALPPAAAPYDPAAAELLRAIAARSEGPFTVAELLLRAEVVADRVEDERLRSAIVGALGELNGKRLGQLLRRVENTDVDSLCVARVGRARDGVSWCVATFEPEKDARSRCGASIKVKSCANGT
jgi:hypothetical protein